MTALVVGLLIVIFRKVMLRKSPGTALQLAFLSDGLRARARTHTHTHTHTYTHAHSTAKRTEAPAAVGSRFAVGRYALGRPLAGPSVRPYNQGLGLPRG